MRQDLDDQVRKLRDQVRALSRMIPEEVYLVDRLMIDLELGDEELYAATKIFEEYERKIEQDSEHDLSGFEQRMRERLGISYQELKQVINAYYFSGQFKRTCRRYAEEIVSSSSINF